MGAMDTEKSCPDCRAAMRLESKTLGFQTFECPKYAFVVIELVKDNPPQDRTVPSLH
jgi:hypothetical protein